MADGRRRSWSLLLRLAIVSACVVYIFWGVDFGALWRAFGRFHVGGMLLAFAWSLLQYPAVGARLSWLTRGRVTVRQGTEASLYGLALNNILPAKLGEAAKAFYLRSQGGVPLGEGLGLIFWERFMDMNCILVLALVSAAVMGANILAGPLLAVVGGGWLCLLLLRRCPGIAAAVGRRLPAGLRPVYSDTVCQLRDGLSTAFLLRLALRSVFVWFMFETWVHLTLVAGCGFDLSFWQALTVFVISTVGFIVPSSPGGAGVYEAATVMALGLFGVGKEEALAAGLCLRVIQYAPQTLGGLAVMIRTGLGVREARSVHASEEEDSSKDGEAGVCSGRTEGAAGGEYSR